jgi:two-component system, LytTR family, response regulator
MKLKAIIVDDEASSCNTLRQKLITYCTEVDVIAECENGEQGIHAIETLKPQIVFLDVEMPRMNGFVMLQQLKNRNFELIFTTAYDHYAIHAIRYSALDYLVKPVEVKELQAAVEKAKQKIISSLPDHRIETLLHNLLEERLGHKRLAVPSMEGLNFIEVNTIMYLQAESNYTVIHLFPPGKITVSKTLKDFEDLLPPSVFIRIHHSYIINKAHIQKYLKGEGGQVVMRNGEALDVSRRKKDEFLKAVNG